MCQAVVKSLAAYRKIAEKQQRHTMLILATDESGDPRNNRMFLEASIAVAKKGNNLSVVRKGGPTRDFDKLAISMIEYVSGTPFMAGLPDN